MLQAVFDVCALPSAVALLGKYPSLISRMGSVHQLRPRNTWEGGGGASVLSFLVSSHLLQMWLGGD